jgi:hypothetical protein
MKKEERHWRLLYSGALALLTGLPYLMGYFAQGSSWAFTGFVFGVEDGNSYIAKMLAGAEGAWLFRTPYTTEPQQGVLAFLPYILLGKLAQGEALHEQLVALFHLFRTAAIPLEVYAVYRFSSLFLVEERWRRWVTVMATAGGGLGWVLLAVGRSSWLGSLPLDLHSPETFGFLAVYGLPHLIVARALLILGLVFYLESDVAPRKGWLAGLVLLGLGMVQPISLVSAMAVLAAHLVVTTIGSARRGALAGVWPWFVAAAKAALVPAPLIAYNIIVFSADPYLRAWTAQNQILSPSPPHYLVAYGLILVPAAAGAWRAWAEGGHRSWLPAAWALAIPLLAYLPLGVQRRLPEGAWVALAVLAAVGCRDWERMRPALRRLAPFLLGASLPSSLILIAGGMTAALRPGEPVFIPRAEARAFTWLGENVEADTNVLAAYRTANALPAWAPLRVVIGHGPETPGLGGLLPQVARFYASQTGDDLRLEFLAEHDVGIVFAGRNEAVLGAWRADETSFLERIYSGDGYSIYSVRD